MHQNLDIINIRATSLQRKKYLPQTLKLVPLENQTEQPNSKQYQLAFVEFPPSFQQRLGGA